MSSVWVQLYYKGEAKPVGEVDPIEISYDSIENVNENVNDLKKKVKEDRVNKLKHADAADLKVYSSGTTVPVKDPPTGPAALAANVIVSEAATGTSYERPLIVIAPKPEQPNGSTVGEKWKTLPSPQIPSKPNEGNFLDVQLLNKAGLVREGENELLFCRLDTLRLWEELSAWSSPTEDGRSVVGLVRGPPGTGT
jgi:hypothetical protein